MSYLCLINHSTLVSSNIKLYHSSSEASASIDCANVISMAKLPTKFNFVAHYRVTRTKRIKPSTEISLKVHAISRVSIRFLFVRSDGRNQTLNEPRLLLTFVRYDIDLVEDYLECFDEEYEMGAVPFLP